MPFEKWLQNSKSPKVGVALHSFVNHSVCSLLDLPETCVNPDLSNPKSLTLPRQLLNLDPKPNPKLCTESPEIFELKTFNSKSQSLPTPPNPKSYGRWLLGTSSRSYSQSTCASRRCWGFYFRDCAWVLNRVSRSSIWVFMVHRVQGLRFDHWRDV